MKASAFPRSYRAFNPDENRMLYQKELTERGFSISPDGLPCCAKENLLDVIVTWFSGKKDGDGLPLYEGDICKVEIKNEFSSVAIDYGVMRWNNDIGQFLLMIPSAQGGVILNVQKVQLLGNEFENQELVPLVKHEVNQSPTNG